LSWPTAISDFIAASLMMIVTGFVPALGRLVERIPGAVAARQRDLSHRAPP
jgi:predicted benzoate:H+ symporter BenE